MNRDFFIQSVWLIGGRYFMFATIAFVLFYVIWRNRFLYKKIQTRFPKNTDYLREIFYSILTICIFSFGAVILFTNPVAAYTTRYTNITQYGWGYYFLIYPVMLLMHDTYFYFTHRLMHNRHLFKWFHLVHHQS